MCKSDRVKRLKHEKYIANSDEMKRKAREYRHANPDKIKALRKKYRENNGDHQREKSRAYYKANTEKLKAYAREYRQSNPEVIRQVNRRIRAKRRGAETEPYTADLIINLYGKNCFECGEVIDLDAPRLPGALGWELSLHLDHRVPLSAGGSDLITNIRPTHAACNLRRARRRRGESDS